MVSVSIHRCCFSNESGGISRGLQLKTQACRSIVLLALFWYIVVINFLTLGAMLLDRAAANAHGSRMSELTIFFFSLIGGIWGTIAGMFLFRHKTQNPDFQAVIILIMLLGRSRSSKPTIGAYTSLSL